MKSKTVTILDRMAKDSRLQLDGGQLAQLDEQIKEGLDRQSREFFREEKMKVTFPNIKMKRSMFVNTVENPGAGAFRYSSGVMVNNTNEYPRFIDVFHNTLHPETEPIVAKQIVTYCRKNRVDPQSLVRDNKVDVFTMPLDPEQRAIFKDRVLRGERRAQVLDWDAMGEYNE